MRNLVFCLSILLLFCGRVDAQPEANSKFSDFEKWLAKPTDERGEFSKQPFRNLGLTKKEAKKAAELLWEDYAARLKKERKKEWTDKVIKLDDLEMKFLVTNQRTGAVFLSRCMAVAERVHVLTTSNGETKLICTNPKRAFIWPQGHRQILGTCGTKITSTFSLSGSFRTRSSLKMSIRIAFTSWVIRRAAMPNGVSPKGLRNIGFTLHMGGQDSAYKRNKIARQWKTKLAKLQEGDPEGYEHEVQIHEECGHWMKRKDAVAVPWMAKFTRDPVPKKIVWRPTGPKDNGFYWLRQREGQAKRGSEVTASLDGQTINIEATIGMKQIGFYLNDEVLDLDESVSVAFNGKLRGARRVGRRLDHMVNSLEAYGDPHRIYSAEFVAPVPKELLEAEAEAKKAAEEAKKKKKMEAEAKKKREAEEKEKLEAEDKEKQAGK